MVMGDTGDRKSGAGPSGVKKFEENCEQYVELARGVTVLDYHAHRPRDPRPPFNVNREVLETSMLGPAQVMRSQVHSSPHSVIYNKDDFNERWISVEITWNYAGNLVAVMGSWDSWQTTETLQHIGQNRTVTKVLPVGIHYYRFIVDGVLLCAPDLQWVSDDYGNRYNILDLQEDILKTPVNGRSNLSEFECPPSPPSSYDNKLLTNEDFYHKTKEGNVREILPPELPPQLEDVAMDEPSSVKPSSSTDIHHCLPRPGFTQLNHLYTRKNDQYVAFCSTQRVGHKFVTAIIYKPLSKTK